MHFKLSSFFEFGPQPLKTPGADFTKMEKNALDRYKKVELADKTQVHPLFSCLR
jgi:hypothetical protein